MTKFIDISEQSLARRFGEKLALDLRLPYGSREALQASIAGLAGAGVGATRGLFDPGYQEVRNRKGRVAAIKKRDPRLAALKYGLIGGSAAALGNYAAQLANNYSPEIHTTLAQALAAIKNHARV